jgi:hypothetical protein
MDRVGFEPTTSAMPIHLKHLHYLHAVQSCANALLSLLVGQQSDFAKFLSQVALQTPQVALLRDFLPPLLYGCLDSISEQNLLNRRQKTHCIENVTSHDKEKERLRESL